MIFDKEKNEYYCEECGNVLKLNFTYDAYFCENCDTWAEKKCNDEFCPYCPDRPDRPSELKED